VKSKRTFYELSLDIISISGSLDITINGLDENNDHIAEIKFIRITNLGKYNVIIDNSALIDNITQIQVSLYNGLTQNLSCKLLNISLNEVERDRIFPNQYSAYTARPGMLIKKVIDLETTEKIVDTNYVDFLIIEHHSVGDEIQWCAELDYQVCMTDLTSFPAYSGKIVSINRYYIFVAYKSGNYDSDLIYDTSNHKLYMRLYGINNTYSVVSQRIVFSYLDGL
jgi:hypothetical protein